MQQKHSYVGPRGWAVLTLVSGAALSAPFFRAPDVDPDRPLPPAASSHTTGLARLASMELPGSDSRGSGSHGSRPSSDYSSYDLSDLSQQILPPANASPTELPAWAPVRSPIDQLISQGTAPAWQPQPESESRLKPLSPWTNEAQALQARPAPLSPPAGTAARSWPDASSLPVANHRQTGSNMTSGNMTSGTAADYGTSSGSNSSASTGGSFVGSLAGTSQATRTTATPRLQAPEPAMTQPARRQFVYQPGYQATSP